MTLNQNEQLKQILEDKKHVLITFGQNAGGDAIASALALHKYLANIGKRSDVVSHDFHLPKQYAFLKGSENIGASLSQVKTFILTLDVQETGVQELSYDLVGEKLRIFITPKEGILNQSHVKTAESDFKYDAIVVLGTQDLYALGPIHASHPTLFETTPVINIDSEASNEHFGHLNIVDVTATSTAEVMYDVLKELGKEYVDADVATGLLTGMIAKTHSFKGENVRPHTLSVAGKLIKLGADRDYIVDNLYRTRTIAALRLWGEALSHLHVDKDLGLVTTSITRDDFVRSGAHKHDLVDIIDELISNSPEAKLILLLHEDVSDHGKIHVTLSASKGYNAVELLKGLNAIGNTDLATIAMRDRSLQEVEEKVKDHIVTRVANLYT